MVERLSTSAFNLWLTKQKKVDITKESLKKILGRVPKLEVTGSRLSLEVLIK